MSIDEMYDSPETRLWRRVDRRTDVDCWNWIGSLSGGYGRLRVGGQRVQAHRFAYELATGQAVAPHLHVDPLCRNQRCCNPRHLEPVTPRENCLRGNSPMAQQARKSQCDSGHPLNGPNIRLRGNKRECRTCALTAHRARHREKRDLINAQKRAWYIKNAESVKAAVRERYARSKAGV